AFSTMQSQVNSDGSITKTVLDFNTDGSLRDQSVTTTSADGMSITTLRDPFGLGFFYTYSLGSFIERRSDVLGINGDGSTTDTVAEDPGAVTVMPGPDLGETILLPQAPASDRAVTTTSANGLSKTTQYDRTGSGTFGETKTDVTVLNTDGSSTETI